MHRPLFNNPEKPKGHAPDSLVTRGIFRFHTFANTRHLAKDRGRKFPASKLQHYTNLAKKSLSTAQKVKVETDTTLPWEHDTEGRLLSTPGDVLAYKIAKLRKWLKMDARKPDPDAPVDPRYQKMTIWTDAKANLSPQFKNAMCSELVKLELENAVTQAEVKFRDGLEKWLLGEGSSDEYETCQWIDHKYIEQKEKALKGQQSMFSSPLTEKQEAEIAACQQHIMKAFGEELWNGFMRDQTEKDFQARTFIQWLERTVPKNDAEAFLYYKYIVKKRPLNFYNSFTPFYMKYFFDPNNPLLATRIEDGWQAPPPPPPPENKDDNPKPNNNNNNNNNDPSSQPNPKDRDPNEPDDGTEETIEDTFEEEDQPLNRKKKDDAAKKKVEEDLAAEKKRADEATEQAKQAEEKRRKDQEEATERMAKMKKDFEDQLANIKPGTPDDTRNALLQKQLDDHNAEYEKLLKSNVELKDLHAKMSRDLSTTSQQYSDLNAKFTGVNKVLQEHVEKNRILEDNARSLSGEIHAVRMKAAGEVKELKEEAEREYKRLNGEFQKALKMAAEQHNDTETRLTTQITSLQSQLAQREAELQLQKKQYLEMKALFEQGQQGENKGLALKEKEITELKQANTQVKAKLRETLKTLRKAFKNIDVNEESAEQQLDAALLEVANQADRASQFENTAANLRKEVATAKVEKTEEENKARTATQQAKEAKDELAHVRQMMKDAESAIAKRKAELTKADDRIKKLEQEQTNYAKMIKQLNDDLSKTKDELRVARQDKREDKSLKEKLEKESRLKTDAIKNLNTKLDDVQRERQELIAENSALLTKLKIAEANMSSAHTGLAAELAKVQYDLENEKKVNDLNRQNYKQAMKMAKDEVDNQMEDKEHAYKIMESQKQQLQAEKQKAEQRVASLSRTAEELAKKMTLEGKELSSTREELQQAFEIINEASGVIKDHLLRAKMRKFLKSQMG